jgi:hypothetical protein
MLGILRWRREEFVALSGIELRHPARRLVAMITVPPAVMSDNLAFTAQNIFLYSVLYL